MSEPGGNLWVLAFDDEYKADEARALFRRMAGEGLLDLEETAVVVVGIDGKATITQDVDIAGERRMQGHWLGIVAAAVTGVSPLILVGTLAGAVVGRLTDHGITTQMMKRIAEAMTPGTSALFGIGAARHDSDREKVIERIRHFHPVIVQASVSPQLKQQILEILETPSEISTA